jgi:DMSO/TMAO reductase YedYZ molybdopterin-dependent catalytic subunit
MRRLPVGAVAGVLSAAFGTAAAELLAAAVRPEAGPLVAVGGAVVDATPTPVKEYAVRQLGTADKPVLLGSIVLVLVLFTAGVGMLATRWRVAAVAGAAVFGAAGAAAALSRPAAVPFDGVPSLLGAALAGAALLVTLRRALALSTPGDRRASALALSTPGDRRASALALSTPGDRAGAGAGAGPGSGDGRAPTRVLVDRRAFLQAASLVAAGAAVAGGGAAVTRRARGGALAASREAVRLPAPADPARPLPAGAGPGFVTANADFYRVDTALTLPRIDVNSWSMRVHGLVEQPAELSFADLLERPLIERHVTLNCVSNEVGGPYVGTARWLGVPLAPLLRELGVGAGADQLVARSVEGMTIGTPVETVLDGRDTMLCVGMNGEPLPIEHGFPVRMLTPGLYGYAGACKWLSELELTTFADFDAYWVRRGWGARGPVKTASRIDRPQPFARPGAGPVTVAGVAWAQGRGISAVEVRVDEGEWRTAELLPVPSVDTWVQWRYAWPATPGPHTLTVRATDGTGAVQPEERVTPFPDGATGWHGVTVTVA